MRESIPSFLPPMLASPGALPECEDGWVAEVKWDGMRAQVRVDGRGRVCVRSRPGRDCTGEFPELAGLAGQARGVLLDGELVCLSPEDGKPDFGLLRTRLGRSRLAIGAPEVTLMIFDVLHHDGRAVRALPYEQRRAVLEALGLDGPHWRTPAVFAGGCSDLAAATRQQQLEGVVLKRTGSPWRPGRRSSAWVKVKHRRCERLVAWGWRPADGERPEEFLLARPDPSGRLRAAGSVSFGLAGEQRANLRLDLQRQARRRGRGGVVWAYPGVEVDVEAHGRPGGPVRDPVLRAVVGAVTDIS